MPLYIQFLANIHELYNFRSIRGNDDEIDRPMNLELN